MLYFQVNDTRRIAPQDQITVPNYSIPNCSKDRSDDEISGAFSITSNITNANNGNGEHLKFNLSVNAINVYAECNQKQVTSYLFVAGIEPRFSTPSGSDLEDSVKSDITSVYPFSAMKRRQCNIYKSILACVYTFIINRK